VELLIFNLKSNILVYCLRSFGILLTHNHSVKYFRRWNNLLQFDDRLSF